MVVLVRLRRCARPLIYVLCFVPKMFCFPGFKFVVVFPWIFFTSARFCRRDFRDWIGYFAMYVSKQVYFAQTLPLLNARRPVEELFFLRASITTLRHCLQTNRVLVTY